MKPRISPQARIDRIVALRCKGCSPLGISKTTGLRLSYVNKVLAREGLLSSPEVIDPWIADFLHRNWHWIVKEPEKTPSEMRHKYRVVYRGQQGIRTMYRPDGIFR